MLVFTEMKNVRHTSLVKSCVNEKCASIAGPPLLLTHGFLPPLPVQYRVGQCVHSTATVRPCNDAQNPVTVANTFTQIGGQIRVSMRAWHGSLTTTVGFAAPLVSNQYLLNNIPMVMPRAQAESNQDIVWSALVDFARPYPTTGTHTSGLMVWDWDGGVMRPLIQLFATWQGFNMQLQVRALNRFSNGWDSTRFINSITAGPVELAIHRSHRDRWYRFYWRTPTVVTWARWQFFSTYMLLDGQMPANMQRNASVAMFAANENTVSA